MYFESVEKKDAKKPIEEGFLTGLIPAAGDLLVNGLGVGELPGQAIDSLPISKGGKVASRK